MSKLRILMASLAAVAIAGALAVFLPMGSASAGECATAWSAGTVYQGGTSVSHNGRNWTAKWWTQSDAPGTTGEWGVWSDKGECGSTGPAPTTSPTSPSPSESPKPDPTTPSPSGFVVSEAQFNQMFPNRNSFYTYKGLTDALAAYPGFAKTGSDTVQKQEAAAFLANINHETGGLVHVVEQNTANYPHYCDASQPYGCPAGQAMYYGRGPIQLSWNFNYKAAGEALGLPLLTNPNMVQNDPAVAMKTGIWYWMTQNGPGTMTPHDAMVNQRGFGETIRSINGSLECNGRNPGQVQSRIDAYQKFVQILGAAPGGNLSC
jgi:predicted chitinase